MKSNKIVRIRALYVNEDKSATDECIVLLAAVADGKITPDKEMYGYHDEYGEEGLLRWPFVTQTDKTKKKTVLNYGDVHADPDSDDCKNETPEQVKGCQFAELIFPSVGIKMNTVLQLKRGDDLDAYQVVEITDY